MIQKSMSLEKEPSSKPLPDGQRSALERRGDNLKGFKGFHLKDGSSRGQNLAVSVLYVFFARRYDLPSRCSTAHHPQWAWRILPFLCVVPCKEMEGSCWSQARIPDTSLISSFVPGSEILSSSRVRNEELLVSWPRTLV